VLELVFLSVGYRFLPREGCGWLPVVIVAAAMIATATGYDLLTPIDHCCNTLVFGSGGYLFGDYARLGAPLSLLVVIVGTPPVMWSRPLR
jgi:di/tricarboxylate transporter